MTKDMSVAEVLEAFVRRHETATQNWTQAAVDAQRSGDRELYVSIRNMVLDLLDSFPVEQARAALRKAADIARQGQPA